MSKLLIHKPIIEKLKYFYENHKIPNILFYGPNGSGKKTILNDFINTIYDNDKKKINNYVMYVNCAHGKGIKFIREELKLFAKTHIFSNGGNNFKSIILLNAEKLTIDAQSSLRRCIELFNHTTRFFIVVEDKYKLLKPILSRFCEIYISDHSSKENINTIQLYSKQLNETFHSKEYKTSHNDWLKKYIDKRFVYEKNGFNTKITDLIYHSSKIYEKGYSGLDMMNLIENNINDKFNHITLTKKYELLFHFHQIKKEFRNEKLIILFFLNFLFLSSEVSLENISFI